MSFTKFMETAGIPVLLCVVCAFFAFRVHLSKDVGMFVGKTAGPLKNEEAFRKGVEKNLIFFSIASLIMAVLVIFDPIMGFIEISGATIIVGIMWNDLTKRYGTETDGKKK